MSYADLPKQVVLKDLSTLLPSCLCNLYFLLEHFFLPFASLEVTIVSVLSLARLELGDL